MEQFLNIIVLKDFIPLKSGKADPFPLRSEILKSVKFVSSEMTEGMGPSIDEPRMCNFFNWINSFMKSGIFPEKLLPETLRSAKLASLERVEGSSPLNSFADKVRDSKLTRFPIAAGIGPENRLLSMLRFFKVVIWVSVSGKGPDKRFPIRDSPIKGRVLQLVGTVPLIKFRLRSSC